MARNKRTPREPYNTNPHVKVFYELPFGHDTITPPDRIRIKNERGLFQVYQFAYHNQTAVTWVDCMSTANGEFRSFYVEKIKAVERKKSIRKKLK